VTDKSIAIDVDRTRKDKSNDDAAVCKHDDIKREGSTTGSRQERGARRHGKEWDLEDRKKKEEGRRWRIVNDKETMRGGRERTASTRHPSS
jgi:hypothetical protein